MIDIYSLLLEHFDTNLLPVEQAQYTYSLYSVKIILWTTNYFILSIYFYLHNFNRPGKRFPEVGVYGARITHKNWLHVKMVAHTEVFPHLSASP